jgi:hypothetical protein
MNWEAAKQPNLDAGHASMDGNSVSGLKKLSERHARVAAMIAQQPLPAS